jgi:hypothetical protein
MKVIAHQAVSVNFKSTVFRRYCQRIQEHAAIRIVPEDVTVVRTTVHDVMPGAGKVLSWRARHPSSG